MGLFTYILHVYMNLSCLKIITRMTSRYCWIERLWLFPRKLVYDTIGQNPPSLDRKATMNKQALLLVSGATVSCLFCTQAMPQPLVIPKNISGFNKVSLTGQGELILKQGPKDSVKIQIESALVPDLNVYKSGSTLNLGLKKNNDKASSLKYYVTMKNINAINDRNSGAVNLATDINTNMLTLSLKNSGSITTKNVVVDGETSVMLGSSGTISLGDLKTKTLNLNLASSGTIDISNVSADSLTSSLRNSGTISISGGAVNHQNVTVYNSGTYRADQLTSKKADIKIRNSGSIYANVSDEISVDISGSGDLYLYGKPSFKSVSTTSGNIHTMK